MKDKDGIVMVTDEGDSHFNYFEADDEEYDREKKIHLRFLRKNFPKVEDIEKMATDIKFDINKLETKIYDILTKHHNDYITTFSTFMDTVRKDIKMKIEQMEKAEEEKRKTNDIRIIKCERDFFRLEAVRLNGLCKEMNGKIDEMTLKMKTLSIELENITKRWKESENMNKQLLVELESYIQAHRELEMQLKVAKEKEGKGMNLDIDVDKKSGLHSFHGEYDTESENAKHNVKSNQSQNEGEEILDTFKKEKLTVIIEKLRLELKKEKLRTHKILGEFNKIILEKSKLETFFIDCVEETRKEIFNRKIRDAIGKKPGTVTNVPFIRDIKYEQFLPTDKKKLIENFLLKEEVIRLILENVFKKRDESNMISKNTNDMNGIFNMQGINILNENRIAGYDLDLAQTKSSFMRTENKILMNSQMKKTQSTGFTYPLQINRSKSPNLNY